MDYRQIVLGSGINPGLRYDGPCDSAVLNKHKGGVWRLLPLGNMGLASASYDRCAKIFQISHPPQESPSIPLNAHRGEVLSLGRMHDGTLITGGSDGQMFFWNIETGTQVNVIREKKKSATGFYSLIALDQHRIATGACQRPKKIPAEKEWKHSIKIWDVATQKTTTLLEGHTGGISALDCTPTRMISASADATLRVWNTISLECLSIIKAHSDYIYTASILEGQYALTGSRDRNIHLLDLETAKPITTFKSKNSSFAHESTVYHVASFQQNLFLSGSRDGSVKVWDTRTVEPIKHYDANQGFVYSVAGLEDGTIVAGTGSQDSKSKKLNEGSLVIWPHQQFKA